MTATFQYLTAFDRNIGWVTEAEQETLRRKRVAIAGMGGVGGVHLLTLVRLGVGNFHISDFDTFDVANFNRQVGASISTVGQPKVEVLSRMAQDINPEVEVRCFSQGVNEANVDEFLDGADLYVDGLDYFAFDARQMLFGACHRRGVPAITVAPAGMGAALLNFMPGGMSFEEYFGLEGRSDLERAVRFAVGLAPAGLHRSYLVDPRRLDVANRKFPSTMMGCQVSAGVAGTEALKILLGRGKVHAAPHGVHFDAFRNQLVRTWRPGGHRHPLQRLAIGVGLKMLQRGRSLAPPGVGATVAAGTTAVAAAVPPPRTPAERVLDLARWAPSGDNTQPWRFEVLDDTRFVIHGFDTREHCVYDLDGHPSQISLGALIETASVAASGEGLALEVQRRSGLPDTTPTFDCHLVKREGVSPSPLLAAITQRSVNRWPYRTRPLTQAETTALESVLDAGYRIRWFEGWGLRWAMARLMFRNAKVRLTMREAYEVHRQIIDWGQRFSEDKVPDQALGADPMTVRMMRFVMASWERVQFFNRYLAGTWAPRIQMDLIPGLRCAAHWVLVRDRPPQGVEDYVDGGRMVQRVWLKATSLGLVHQPEITPLVFARYVREGRTFTTQDRPLALATRLAEASRSLLGEDLERAVWIGRLGEALPAPSRSLRLALPRLAWTN